MTINTNHTNDTLTPSGGTLAVAGGATLTTALPIGSGGTGQTTANTALNALLPAQTGNTGKVLSTDGTNTSWATGGGGSFTGGTLTSQLQLSVGTATAGTAPLEFQSGTNLTTAEAGSVEYDGNTFYASIAASTRCVMPTEQIVFLTGTNTLTSQIAAQPIFDGGGGSTNGAVTLPIGTYQFECSFAANGLSTSSGSFGFAIGGSATKTYSYQAIATKNSALSAPLAETAGATYSSFNTGAQTALVSANVRSTCTAFIAGVVRVTVAGTIIPQISLGVAAAAVIQDGSYFKISSLGNVSTVARVGNWS